MEQFTHNKWHRFTRWEEYQYWRLDFSLTISDLYREMDALIQDGIPQDAIHIVHMQWERRGYDCLTIDFSANEQVEALAERIHQAWMAQKAIEAERYRKQRELAIANQQAQCNFDGEW